jgi:hypothetical protein
MAALIRDYSGSALSCLLSACADLPIERSTAATVPSITSCR